MLPRSLMFVCALCVLSAFGQSRPEGEGADSSAHRGILLLDPGVSLGRPTFLLPASVDPELPFLADQLLMPGDSPLDRIPFTAGMAGSRVDLTLPLRLQMAKENGWGALSMTLSAAGAGAAAYMAYEHVRKYGLFK